MALYGCTLILTLPKFSTDPAERTEEERCAADVATFGLHVLKVGAEEDSPTFCYSVGLHRSFGHPEIIILGLALDTMHQILNDLAGQLRTGKRYGVSEIASEFLEGYDVTFRDVPKRQYGAYLGWATWFNEGREFPTLQMIYPDRERRWPWDAGVSTTFRANQPILEDEPVPVWARDAV